MQGRYLLESRILKAIKEIEDGLIELSHDFSSHPETALKEYRTRDRACDFLHKHGFDIKKGVGGIETSFRASRGRQAHPSIAYVAEMDALPGIGHACGHNVNGVMSIGAAIALSKALRPDKGRISVVGTPAEETGFGKPELIKHGIFKSYDVAMMSHASTKRMSSRYMLALKKIKIMFRGKASHAASYPEEGRDALSALILAINNVNSMRSSFKPYMRVNGIITQGGVAPNIIPDFAEAFYFIRAISMPELHELMEWVKNAVDGAAMATGTKAEIMDEGYVQYPFYVNEALTGLYSDVLESLGLKQTILSPYQGIGSSDIGQLSYTLPTLHTYTPIGEGAHIHTREFRELARSQSADKGIAEGAAALALTGYKLMRSPALMKKIRQSHNPPSVLL